MRNCGGIDATHPGFFYPFTWTMGDEIREAGHLPDTHGAHWIARCAKELTKIDIHFPEIRRGKRVKSTGSR